MTNDELLDGIRGRIDRAVNAMAVMAEDAANDNDFRYAEHLLSKRAGLLVVKDWLRAYP